jgi:exosortase A-associated hydrolase 2
LKQRISGHFIDGPKGPLFTLLREPNGEADGCVLVVPPFAEEMNKCRRMVALTSSGLAGRGIATLLPDLFGTGDSGGHFHEATWGTWIDDVARVADFARGSGLELSGVLAIRSGCWIAERAAAQGLIGPVGRTSFWQPVFDLGSHLRQFLRLRLAASLSEGVRESIGDLNARFAAGESIEVAGYVVSATMADEMKASEATRSISSALGRVRWLEFSRGSDGAVSKPASELVERSRAAGTDVEVETVPGEPFWSATEIVVNEIAVARTLAAFGCDSRMPT